MSGARIRRREPGRRGDWPERYPELLRRLYAARGADGPAQAQPRLADLPSPDAMPGIEAATGLLEDAISRDRRIVVVADFDCDGATACATGVRGLRMLGARNVAYAVPNRAVHGYGLTPALVEELAALHPELLVTVDHGIACHAGIAAARARGWDVLVTDHHLPGETLPNASVIVNPALPGHDFGSRALAGVGVLFYLLLALRKRLRESGKLSSPEPDISALLDLVAVGTVADLVPLDACNRALVSAGLRRLRTGQGSAGLNALAQVAGRERATLTASDIGFGIAPRINAAGRLEDMTVGIECLLCDEPVRALELATALDAINRERRALQQHTTDEAEAAFAGLSNDWDSPPIALCLFDPEWHAGVIGLVASKLAQRAHRPAVVFAPSQPGSGELRGSARSIPGLHIRDALAAVDSAKPGLIERFGGHAMAAGLTLAESKLPTFETALREAVASMLDPAILQAELWTDGELEPRHFDRMTADLLRDAGPWGQGWPEPLFDGIFDVLASRSVGERHLKLELGLDGKRLNAIHFGGWNGEAIPKRIRIAYRLQGDDWRGGDAVQLIVEHLEPA
ncbi:MAG TPA: single-stranded-DNA-specific exonuclease RecJ [Lysobacter sp.]|nr:single-stranded-DNA-specific exonuclease RecJ [Lysobacter sp.]